MFIIFQAVIDANIFPVLIDILVKAEYKTRKVSFSIFVFFSMSVSSSKVTTLP